LHQGHALVQIKDPHALPLIAGQKRLIGRVLQLLDRMLSENAKYIYPAGRWSGPTNPAMLVKTMTME
jgi:hypothetical protein